MNARNPVNEFVVASIVALVVFLPTIVSLFAQAPPAGFPDLVGALRATPGNLGVEVAETGSGKQVIFAWFENKKAVLNWYYSQPHLKAMRAFPSVNSSGHKPLSEVADDSGPIMAIASVTFSDLSRASEASRGDKPQSAATSLPISQIAIELYAPLPGGIALGGRFAPNTVKVPGLRETGMQPRPFNTSDQRSTRQAPITQRGSSTLTIKVVGARNAQGTLAVAVWKDATAFPEDARKAIRQRNIDIDAKTLSAQTVFDNLPLGVYAVAVYHDENSNGKLDRGMFGRPTEGYGASNDARSMFSAPSFDEAKFSVKSAAQTIEIKLGY